MAYGLFGMAAGLLLLDGFISFGSFSPPSQTSMTSVPRGMDVGIGMVFLAMGALGLFVGYQLSKSKVAGIAIGVPLLLAGAAFAAFFASINSYYPEFNAPTLFLGLDAVMALLVVKGWRNIRHSDQSRGPPPATGAPVRNFTLLAVAIVIAALVISASLLSYTSFESTVSETTTATLVTTSISVSLITSVTTSTTTVTETTTTVISPTCVQLESASMFLTVKNSSTGAPITSLPVQVEELPSPCSTTAQTTLDLGIMDTNVNGSIEVCCTGSTFFFMFTYQGATYHISELANGAESAECVTFYVPSNTTTINYAGDFVYYC